MDDSDDPNLIRDIKKFAIGSDLDFDFEDADGVPAIVEVPAETTTQAVPSVILSTDNSGPLLTLSDDPFFGSIWPVDEWKAFVRFMTTKLGVSYKM